MLVGDIRVEEIGKGNVVHDQVTLLLIHLQEEGVVGDDVPVMQVLDIGEVALQEQDVLAVQTDRFHCQGLVAVPVLAFLYDPVGALSDLVPD